MLYQTTFRIDDKRSLIKKRPPISEAFSYLIVLEELLLQLSIAAHEAVNATCSINELALTCVEWV